MAAKKSSKRQPPKVKPPAPDPWDGEGEETTDGQIGRGFVRWGKPGEHIRGIVRNRWQSKGMNRPAIALELTEEPNVTVTEYDEPIPVEVGEIVNVGLTRLLEKRIGPDLVGEEVGIAYIADKPTQHGNPMRDFVVKLFKIPF